MVMNIKDHLASLQKMNASGLFRSKSYEVPLEELLPVVHDNSNSSNHTNSPHSSSSDEDDDDSDSSVVEEAVLGQPAVPTTSNASPNVAGSATAGGIQQRPSRLNRREPSWLRGDIWDRE